MKARSFGAVMLAALLPALAATATHAQMRGRLGGGEPAAAGQGGVERLDHVIRATGLAPVFPPGFACIAIASPWGSPTRHDGSPRRGDRNAGLHGGMDLTLAEGTPLLAIAAGEVIAKGEGGRLEGNYLWLRHAPADTGHPFWTFSKYQHLSELPVLDLGSRVAVGQVVALSGSSGTAGPQYGPAGYPHLHLTTFYGSSGEFEKVGMHGSMVRARDSALDDPLIVYLQGIDGVAAANALPEEKRRVAVSVVDDKGALHPAGSRTAWPVACRRN